MLDVDRRWWSRVRDDLGLFRMVRRWFRGGVLIKQAQDEMGMEAVSESPRRF